MYVSHIRTYSCMTMVHFEKFHNLDIMMFQLDITSAEIITDAYLFAAKFYSTIFLNLIIHIVMKILRKNQNDFRNDRSSK